LPIFEVTGSTTFGFTAGFFAKILLLTVAREVSKPEPF
jgi:hypothetical protein